MIVGLDLDEVLCAFLSRINKFLDEEYDFHFFENDLVDYHLERLSCIPKSISERVQENIYNGEFARTAMPTPYAEHAMNKLRIAGFKIHIITHRHEDPFRYITEEWLNKHNLYYDELHLTHYKHDIIDKFNIQAMVDDRFDVLGEIHRKCGSIKHGLYCIDVPWSKRFHNDFIIKVSDVAQAVDLIIKSKENQNVNRMSQMP